MARTDQMGNLSRFLVLPVPDRTPDMYGAVELFGCSIMEGLKKPHVSCKYFLVFTALKESVEQQQWKGSEPGAQHSQDRQLNPGGPLRCGVWS